MRKSSSFHLNISFLSILVGKLFVQMITNIMSSINDYKYNVEHSWDMFWNFSEIIELTNCRAPHFAKKLGVQMPWNVGLDRTDAQNASLNVINQELYDQYEKYDNNFYTTSYKDAHSVNEYAIYKRYAGGTLNSTLSSQPVATGHWGRRPVITSSRSPSPTRNGIDQGWFA